MQVRWPRNWARGFSRTLSQEREPECGLNDDQKKEYLRQYYIRNEDKIREAKRLYRLLNKDKIKESDRLYRLQNQDKLKKSKRQYDLRYRVRNEDKLREALRAKYIRQHEHPHAYLPRAAPQKSWKSPSSVRKYFEAIAKELHVNEPTDWYRISRTQIRNLGGV
jgi:hypothetical protein